MHASFADGGGGLRGDDIYQTRSDDKSIPGHQRTFQFKSGSNDETIRRVAMKSPWQLSRPHRDARRYLLHPHAPPLDGPREELARRTVQIDSTSIGEHGQFPE